MDVISNCHLLTTPPKLSQSIAQQTSDSDKFPGQLPSTKQHTRFASVMRETFHGFRGGPST